MCSGVNGIVTDNIATLATLHSRRTTSGEVRCCHEDSSPWGWLAPFDIRVVGQGCAQNGLNYHDREVTSCPLFPLDFMETGSRFSCRKMSFCKI